VHSKSETAQVTVPGMRRKLVSLLVPARNEQGNLPRVFDEVSAVFAGLPYDYEVVLLDNASTDETPQIAREFCRRDPRWRYLRLSRDFSVEGSLAAGLRAAQGDAAIVLFSDLQDPPACIPEFLARWEDGYDVVYGVLENRGHEPFWKSLGAGAVYRFVSRFAATAIPSGATDFRLFSRRAIELLNQCGEQNRYLRGLSHWIGYPSYPVRYARRPRVAGKSKASLSVMFHLAGNALTGFTLAPLRACLLCGLIFAAATVVLGCLSLLGWLLGGSGGIGVVGTLLMAQLAATCLCTGILGEYVGRTYWEAKQRPLYAVEDTCNLPSPLAENRVTSGAGMALLHSFPAAEQSRKRHCSQEHCHAA
jgi:glycosyltransferase involved in cell wall biosynthesis